MGGGDAEHVAFARGYRRDEEGGSVVEYALLFVLIVLACIAAIGFLGTTLSSFFSNTAARLLFNGR